MQLRRLLWLGLPLMHCRQMCSAVLFPMVVTVYITWWFLTFFDNFFSVRTCDVCLRCTRAVSNHDQVS